MNGTTTRIEDLIPKCLMVINEDDLQKVGFFYKDVSVRLRNEKDMTDAKIIRNIINSILRAKKGETNNINVLLLLGLENPTIQHAELSQATLVEVLLNETNELKQMDRVNTVLSKIIGSMSPDVREQISPNMKGDVSTILLGEHKESFEDTNNCGQYGKDDCPSDVCDLINPSQNRRFADGDYTNDDRLCVEQGKYRLESHKTRNNQPLEYTNNNITYNPDNIYNNQRNNNQPANNQRNNNQPANNQRNNNQPANNQRNNNQPSNNQRNNNQPANNQRNNNKNKLVDDIIKALYVDGEPDLRIGENGKLYYHDKNSNSLTEITSNQLNNKSNNNIDNIIVDYKLPQAEADKLLQKNDVKPTMVEADSDDEIAGMSKVEFAFMIIGIVIGFVILLITIYYVVEYFSSDNNNSNNINLNNNGNNLTKNNNNLFKNNGNNLNNKNNNNNNNLTKNNGNNLNNNSNNLNNNGNNLNNNSNNLNNNSNNLNNNSNNLNRNNNVNNTNNNNNKNNNNLFKNNK
jgi:hypothetical protein